MLPSTKPREQTPQACGVVWTIVEAWVCPEVKHSFLNVCCTWYISVYLSTILFSFLSLLIKGQWLFAINNTEKINNDNVVLWNGSKESTCAFYFAVYFCKHSVITKEFEWWHIINITSCCSYFFSTFPRTNSHWCKQER